MPNHTFPQGAIIEAVNAQGRKFEINVSEIEVDIDDGAQEYEVLQLQTLVQEFCLRKKLKSNPVISTFLLQAYDGSEVSQTAESIKRELDKYFDTFTPDKDDAYPLEIAFPFHVCGHWQVMGLRVNQDKAYQVHLFDSSTEQTDEGGIAAINDNILPILTSLDGYKIVGNGSIFYHKPYRQSGLRSVDMTLYGGSSDVTEVNPEFQTSDCGVYAMQTMSNISDFGFNEAARNKSPNSFDGAAIVGVGAKLRAEQAVRLLVYGAEEIDGVLNIQDLKDHIAPQMADERSLSPIELPPEGGGIFDDLMQLRVTNILEGSSDNAVYFDLESRKDGIVAKYIGAFPETEEGKGEYCLTDDQVSQATQFFIGKDALVINRSHSGQVDNLKDVVEIIENAEIVPDEIITFSYRNGFHFMSVVIDVRKKNINFTNSFEDKSHLCVGEFLEVAENRGLRQVLDEKFREGFKITMTPVEERVVQDEASEGNEGDNTTCGVHAILNNSIGVLRARCGDEDPLPMIKIKMREILGVEVEGESLQNLMLNAKQQCFSSEALKLKMKERAVCAAEISKEILQSEIYPKSTTAAYLQTVVDVRDAEAIKYDKRNALVATLQDDIEALQSDEYQDESDEYQDESDEYQDVLVALEAFKSLCDVDKVRTIWQQQLKLTPSLNIAGIENTESAEPSKQHFFISQYATAEELGLVITVKNILEDFLEADVDDQENRSKAIRALQESLVAQNLERPTLEVIPEDSNNSSETSSFKDSSGILSRTTSEGSFLPQIDKKASQKPVKELGKIWEEDGVTKRNINNPFPSPSPSPSVKVVTAVLMKVPTVKNSAFHGKDRGDDYKTIEGAYSEDKSERAKEVAEIMAFILSQIAYHPLVKIKNDGKSLSKEQLLGIIDYAKENGGVKSKINKSADANKFPLLWADESKMNEVLKTSGVTADLAKFVSGKYQEQCKLCGILSGREDSNFGSRINFLTPQARAILEDATESYGKIKPRVGENTPQAKKFIVHDCETVEPFDVQKVIKQKIEQVAKITGRVR